MLPWTVNIVNPFTVKRLKLFKVSMLIISYELICEYSLLTVSVTIRVHVVSAVASKKGALWVQVHFRIDSCETLVSNIRLATVVKVNYWERASLRTNITVNRHTYENVSSVRWYIYMLRVGRIHLFFLVEYSRKCRA